MENNTQSKINVDVTTIIVGVLAVVALVGSITLSAIHADPTFIASLGGIVTSAIAFLLGLHQDKPEA